MNYTPLSFFASAAAKNDKILSLKTKGTEFDKTFAYLLILIQMVIHHVMPSWHVDLSH